MAQYIIYRKSIYEYYKQLAEFSLNSRNKEENSNIKSALNLNIILTSACFVEGFMERSAKCVLGYYRIIYNDIDIPELQLRKPMNEYFQRIEADVYQRISQGTGIDNYDKLFQLILGKSFKQDVSFQSVIESIQVLFQLRNVIAHAKEISAYEVSSYWNNHTFEENFIGGYKKAENHLIKKGIIKEHFVKTQDVEQFFTDPVADYFYNAVQQFTNQIQIFVEDNMIIGTVLTNKLNEFNSKNSTNYSIMDFCEMNAYAIDVRTIDAHEISQLLK